MFTLAGFGQRFAHGVYIIQSRIALITNSPPFRSCFRLIELLVFPLRLLVRARLLHPRSLRLNSRPTNLSLFQLIKLLPKKQAGKLSVLFATACMLALDHNPSRQMFQLNGAGGLVDFLTTRACSSQERLGDFIVGDLTPGW
jgi:hypothetical protein